MTDTGPTLKHVPADFLVRESVVLSLSEREASTHEYLTLRKCGYTTSEAVVILAEALKAERGEVSYAGRKDEDGITEQLVAVPTARVAQDDGGTQWTVRDGTRWITASHYGYGTAPLSIGKLPGNCFRIVVRDLDPATCGWLADAKKRTSFFLNYYDTQRFGVPGGPKRTHYVGEAILAGDWDRALAELCSLQAPESAAALRCGGSAEAFFRAMDPRNASFYLAAHASAGWNNDLDDFVSVKFPDSYCVTLEGLRYRWVRSAAEAASVLAELPLLPYSRYQLTSDGVEKSESERTTVVQCSIGISEYGEDEAHPGRARVTLGLFLPSGSYATAAVRQFFSYGC
jgi:tRNA pseudouridine13 synthase